MESTPFSIFCDTICRDHFRFWDHLRSKLGIICGTKIICGPGSFAGSVQPPKWSRPRLKLTPAFFGDPEFIWAGLSSFPEMTFRNTEHGRRTKPTRFETLHQTKLIGQRSTGTRLERDWNEKMTRQIVSFKVSFALRIPAAHDIRVISARTWARARTERKRFPSK